MAAREGFLLRSAGEAAKPTLLRLAVAAVLAFAAPVPAGAASAEPTPAQRRIEQAQRSIARAPSDAAGHVELAMALAQRARETADHELYARADEAIGRAVALDPGSFEAAKARVWVRLGQHRFADARELAEALNQRVPDDVTVYGLLTDANAELGDYERAEKACQWMLDLRPGNVPALTRAAYLRELFGDAEGALELMQQALDATPADDSENYAWILTQMAHLHLLTGKVGEAERLLDAALSGFPGYHYALAELAEVRAAQGRHADSVQLLRRRYEAAPHPENLYDLAVALQRAGQRAEAGAAFAEFEERALAETHGADNANRELILYYADHAQRPAEALAVARREIARRHDVHTLDAYAWALYRTGDFAEARKAIERVLDIGFREASVLYHAGAIAAALGDGDVAAERLEQSLALNPNSEVADAARRALPDRDPRAIGKR